MIICTEHTLTVGERRYGPTTDADLNYHDVAFVVLRETTEEEYRSHALEITGRDAGPPFSRPMRFYAVAMD